MYKDGEKIMTGKNQLDLIPPEIILSIGKVLTYGTTKYPRDSWKSVKDKKNVHYGALLRHLMAWRCGIMYDDESGYMHLEHALTNLAFLVYHDLMEEKDGSNN